MKRKLIDILRCPDCNCNFSLESYGGKGDAVLEGVLICGCGATYPIVNGIPRILPDAYADYPAFVRKYKERLGGLTNKFPEDRIQKFQKTYGTTRISFGWEWTRYKSQDIEEDEAIFSLRTSLSPSSLKSKWLLDAGCGGGRYAYVCANAGAEVVAVDISNAVEECAALTKNLPNVHIIQADIENLPLRKEYFDYIYSIGALHHSHDTAFSFGRLVPFLKKRGSISIWVYKRNTYWQELINKMARSLTTQLQYRQLHLICHLAIVLGGIPGIKHLSKVLNFSTHPDPGVRLRDTFDWYAPKFQWHHTEEEVRRWFDGYGFSKVDLFRQENKDAFYNWAYRHNLIIGSGIGVVGIKDQNG